jgi:hypothetical protein
MLSVLAGGLIQMQYETENGVRAHLKLSFITFIINSCSETTFWLLVCTGFGRYRLNVPAGMIQALLSVPSWLFFPVISISQIQCSVQ